MRVVTAADRAEVIACLARIGLGVTPEQADRLAAFARLLEKWNRVYNLTGIRSRRLLLDRHIAESLALGPLLRGERIADVGSGAGLPGLPLAIAHPERQFTLIESRRKRVNFMRQVVLELALDNVTIEHCRAEDLPCQTPFATVLARAVAAPAELLRIVGPLTATGSVLVLLTSAEIARRIVEIADEFSEVRLPAGFGRGLRSSVVALERAGHRHSAEPVRKADG